MFGAATLRELHADTVVLAPNHLTAVLGGANFQVETIRHADQVAEPQTAADLGEIAHGAVEDRAAIVENDPRGLQGAHARPFAALLQNFRMRFGSAIVHGFNSRPYWLDTGNLRPRRSASVKPQV
jgi:hypothetical protein